MIVYQQTKSKFLDDVFSNDIENIIHDFFRKKLNRSTQKNEIRSWKESMNYMDRILRDAGIPDDCGVSIEYQIPQTGKRIDFILAGQNERNQDQVILIELKQWSSAQLTFKDGLVSTRFEKGNAVVSHPAYQAWSYATLLQGFNETIYKENIQLVPCAYLHNYIPDDVILNPFYQDYIDKAPVFLKNDARQLQEFIKRHVKYGDKSDILFRIESGKIKPSKSLADSMVAMLKGKQEFVLIDDQKVVYETALALAKQSSDEKKTVLIIEGGPGTGKSVVAINLLVELTRLGLMAQYVSKNAAPRAVYEARLTGSMRATAIRNLFKGSGAFIGIPANTFDSLIVDEAHRLNEQSGLYGNRGENQIKEIIKASRSTVFFIDEDQRVTLNDIGHKQEIIKWANYAGAEIEQMELTSQFRCNGSDGYLAWLDNILQIRETANETLLDMDYDFKVVGSPSELRDIIFEKNKINNKARLVAGYCWNWVSKKDPNAYDIAFPEYDFKMRWNLQTDGSLWIISPDSVNEVGCIHTCQGLEVDYIGVIVGPDFVVRKGEVLTNPALRAKSDASTNRHKSFTSKNRLTARDFIDKIIKNTYRALMTRGMKGCYVYFTDKETEQYFKALL
ncbi:MAG: family ATPase [Mucilaginibacter sp.]|nr:family ATPase [Mucilaginibacter sp.]